MTDVSRTLHVLDLTIGAQNINALGHLEAGSYVTLFERAIAPLFSRIGLTDERLLHISDSGAISSPFLVEMHVSYLAELNPGDSIAISAQLIEHDDKRARLMLTMAKAPNAHVAAACELLILNMDTGTRKPCPWSTTQATAWHNVGQAQLGLPTPKHAGRAIVPLNPT